MGVVKELFLVRMVHALSLSWFADLLTINVPVIQTYSNTAQSVLQMTPNVEISIGFMIHLKV